MGGTGVSLLLPGVPLHCLKVPEGMACFTQLQAEPAVEIYPPRLQGPCGLCIYELCFLRWLLPNFFSQKWQWGRLGCVLGGSLAKAKGEVFTRVDFYGGLGLCPLPLSPSQAPAHSVSLASHHHAELGLVFLLRGCRGLAQILAESPLRVPPVGFSDYGKNKQRPASHSLIWVSGATALSFFWLLL